MMERVGAICPYCGYMNTIAVNTNIIERVVVLCDCEEGPGCDQYFVAEVKFIPVVKVFSM